MFNRTITITLIIGAINGALAQQNPTGPAIPANTPLFLPAVRNAVENAWYRGGNFLGGDGGSKNIFGTMWNSPIYTKTNGKTHTRLNGDLTTIIKSVNQNVDGYFGISHDPASATSFFDNNHLCYLRSIFNTKKLSITRYLIFPSF